MRAVWTSPKVLVTIRPTRSRSAPRDVSGHHVLNKRESQAQKRSDSVPLSYRMERGPGIKDGFTREKRSRVSLHLVVLQLRVCSERREEARGGGNRRGRRRSEGEAVAGVAEEERTKRRERKVAPRTEGTRVIMHCASAVPR